MKTDGAEVSVISTSALILSMRTEKPEEVVVARQAGAVLKGLDHRIISVGCFKCSFITNLCILGKLLYFSMPK
jgi:hypothetical protein